MRHPIGSWDCGKLQHSQMAVMCEASNNGPIRPKLKAVRNGSSFTCLTEVEPYLPSDHLPSSMFVVLHPWSYSCTLTPRLPHHASSVLAQHPGLASLTGCGELQHVMM